MTAMEEVHAEAHEWQEQDEPVAGEYVCPMLGDQQKRCHGEKADDSQADCRPPEGLRSGVFGIVHYFSNPAHILPLGQRRRRALQLERRATASVSDAPARNKKVT
jgi:hypothetical protein